MQSVEVKRHWERLAQQHGSDLKATTHTPTIKRLEVAALARAIRAAGINENTPAEILEVGCGNGHNLLALNDLFPEARFTGVDYVPEMIYAAPKDAGIRFEVGDALTLSDGPDPQVAYDVVFTDRLLINLASLADQLYALDQLAAKVRPGGHLIILENTIQAREQQNDLREAAGLPRRPPPDYNLYVDEVPFLAKMARDGLRLVLVDEFAALHDLMLYVLAPMVNGNIIDFDDPTVRAATELLLARPDAGGVRGAGQNRLYLFAK